MHINTGAIFLEQGECAAAVKAFRLAADQVEAYEILEPDIITGLPENSLQHATYLLALPSSPTSGETQERTESGLKGTRPPPKRALNQNICCQLQVPRGHGKLRARIMRNIGVAFARMGRYQVRLCSAPSLSDVSKSRSASPESLDAQFGAASIGQCWPHVRVKLLTKMPCVYGVHVAFLLSCPQNLGCTTYKLEPSCQVNIHVCS